MDANERRQIGDLSHEWMRNTYKSGCEWFHNIQKRMQTVFGRADHCGADAEWGAKRFSWTNREVGGFGRGVMVNGSTVPPLKKSEPMIESLFRPCDA